MRTLIALALLSAIVRADLNHNGLEEEERTLGDSEEKSIQYKSAGQVLDLDITENVSTCRQHRLSGCNGEFLEKPFERLFVFVPEMYEMKTGDIS